MEPIMYIFLNKGVKMSKGKSAVQAAHAAVLAYKISEFKAREEWDCGSFTKILLCAENEKHIQNIQTYLEQNEINSVSVNDEGRTEIAPNTLTALGVEILNDEDKINVLKTFKLY